jgi:hypothetical protein
MATVKYAYGGLFDLEISAGLVKLDPYASSVRINRKYNSATSITITFNSNEVLDLLRVGMPVNFYGGRDFAGGTAGITPFRLKTTVQIIRPTETGCVAICADMISRLATSELIDYKANDYVGEDLMQIAKSVFDTLDEDTTKNGDTLGFRNQYIKTDLLDTVGCGIPATESMNIWGLQTKKQFVDNLFGYMYKKIEGEGDTEYPDNYTWIPYRYQITYENYIQFYHTDTFHKRPVSVMTLSDEDSDMITGGGIIGQIDMSQSFNSVTAVSSIDKTIMATYEDQHSMAFFGKNSKKIVVDSTEKDHLEFIAMQVVERTKMPTYSYSVTLRHNEFFIVGDPITVQAPSLGVDVTLPISEVEIMIGNGSVETKLKLGERSLPVDQLINLITANNPTI